MNRLRYSCAAAALIAATSFSLPLTPAAETNEDSTPFVMRVAIDASDLPRRLLSAKVELPLVNRESGSSETDDLDSAPAKDKAKHEVALWYPKWVPGSHGPGGPIANVAGILVEDDQGHRLEWRRTVGEPHRILVEANSDVQKLIVSVRYIANQPTTNSMGHDSFGSALVGIVSPSSALFYQEGIDVDETQVAATLKLPAQWKAASALPVAETAKAVAEGALISFQQVSLRTFVDSPILCGKHHRTHNLVEAAYAQNQETPDKFTIPPHRLQLFSEAESVLEVPAEILSRFRKMVTQAGLLFRSHPYPEFDILLATSDLISRNGLEHSRSSLNVLGQRTLQSTDALKGWDRLLVPHEFIHAWCGKYRRPAGMVTSDFHTSKATELLWVYEGLTQYLGELVEARSGFMTADEFQHRLLIEVRSAMYQQGRQWRSLADTGACSNTLRAGSSSWPRLRRSQDYYMEGMLFWLEADAIIRNRSQGQKSLDDFCQSLFHFDVDSPHPNGYERSDIVKELQQVVAFDWDGLIARRIEQVADRFDPQVVDRLGYSIQYSNEEPDVPSKTFRKSSGVDAIDSLGAVFTPQGEVGDLLLHSPSDKAGLGPGMKIIGINGHAWSENRMRDAIAQSTTTGIIELMTVSGDSFETLKIDYDGGPRFMTLVRKEAGKDVLAEILQPLE
jgi:predicted metalloprotease with PDZ domain